jgi:hypothetical protein
MTDEPIDTHTQFHIDGKCDILNLTCIEPECRACIVPLIVKINEVTDKLSGVISKLDLLDTDIRRML